MAKETLRCEWVKCGKSSCRSCPHGPYWYAYWREGKRTRKRYCGKGDPRTAWREEAEQAERKEEAPKRDQAEQQAGPWHPHDAILNDGLANSYLAREILGVPASAKMEEVSRAYRTLSMRLHPDRAIGQDQRAYLRVQAAYAYLRKFMAR